MGLAGMGLEGLPQAERTPPSTSVPQGCAPGQVSGWAVSIRGTSRGQKGASERGLGHWGLEGTC